MTKHGKERLMERYHMPMERFYKLYANAVTNKCYFKKEYQESKYSNYGTNICIVLASKILMVVALDNTGKIRTIFTPSRSDYEKARILGYNV